MEKEAVHVWTDGACIGNPGPGGWGYLAEYGVKRRTGSGQCAAHTTNNQMELVAVIQAIRSMKRLDLPVVVHTDSAYVVKGINQYIATWIANGWRTSDRKPVANRELWEELMALRDARSAAAQIAFVWVKGHAGCPKNETADALAGRAARNAASVSVPVPALFDRSSGTMRGPFEVESA